jgi:hypothetical protein
MILSDENMPNRFNIKTMQYRLMVERMVKNKADWNIELRSSVLLFSEHNLRVEELKPMLATMIKMDR